MESATASKSKKLRFKRGSWPIQAKAARAVALLALVQMAGLFAAGVSSAQETNPELWEGTGGQTRNVYLCPACSFEQFLAVPLPGPNWSRNVFEGDNRQFLPDAATNTPPSADILPPGTALTLDLVPELEGQDHVLVARVLPVSVLDFGAQGAQAIARVARGTTLTYDAGRVVHRVTSTAGEDYVLFSIADSAAAIWDPTVMNGLAGLSLPLGWTYSSEVLADPLVVGTPEGVAEVFTVPEYWTWQRVLVVPEPSTGLLVGLGLAALAARRRER